MRWERRDLGPLPTNVDSRLTNVDSRISKVAFNYLTWADYGTSVIKRYGTGII